MDDNDSPTTRIKIHVVSWRRELHRWVLLCVLPIWCIMMGAPACHGFQQQHRPQAHHHSFTSYYSRSTTGGGGRATAARNGRSCSRNRRRDVFSTSSSPTSSSSLAVVFDNKDIPVPPIHLEMNDNQTERDLSDDIENDDDDDDLPLNQKGADDRNVEPSPETQKLIARLTENYVFGKTERDFTVDDILNVIEKDFYVRNAPVQIGETLFDATSTGVAIDQTITEILSFAAYHGLPKRLTAELLDDSLGDPFATAKKIFLAQGWKSVSFPEGLAIQPRAVERPSRMTRRLRWWTLRKQRIEEAMRAVQAAAAARSPIRQLQTPKDFLAKLIMTEEYAVVPTMPSKQAPFFPSNLPVPRVSWRRLRRSMERASSKIKKKSKAGVLAYAMFNFVVYTIGMHWQWGRIAPAEITSASNALNLTVRKFCRVFGTVYIISNLLKIPKLLSIAGLVPVTDRVLQASHEKTGLSETRLLVIFVSVLTALWMAATAVPVVTEFSRLRKLIMLETLFDQVAAEPVAHLTVA